jgi:hypothetical protein
MTTDFITTTNTIAEEDRTEVSCERCGSISRKTAMREHPFTKMRLCANCINIQCHDCGGDRDVLVRTITREGIYLSLCVACCATYPGREWMRRTDAERDENLRLAREYLAARAVARDRKRTTQKEVA